MILALVAGALPLPPVGLAGNHPRLLLSPTEVARLRHVSGIGAPAMPELGWGRFGARAADYQAVRSWFAERSATDVLPGEMLAAGFLHLADATDPRDAERCRWLRRLLTEATPATTDMLELTLALDWAWDAIDATARRDFIMNARAWAEPLTASDSPLESRRFRLKLAALAVAAAVDESDDPSPSWREQRGLLIDAAREYFKTTFPRFVAWRGLSPTGPGVAAYEECDATLAIELAAAALGRDLWADHRDDVGRWLEHYVLATLGHPAVQHHFLRDDAQLAPLTTAPVFEALLPITAHLIAARTRDPAAATVAERVDQDLRQVDATRRPGVLWRWVPLAWSIEDLPRCDLARLPIARNLGSAVVLRGGQEPDASAVWIDAAQPFLRRRQHFDAGHFLIHRAGHLAVSGAEDVDTEAVAQRGGSQHLGASAEPFEFEQYATATIAHNCVLLWDPLRVPRWYDQRYVPLGGQRCIENTCSDFTTPLDRQGRETGRMLAYGANDTTAYVALDLTAAYDPRVFSSYTREFIWLSGPAGGGLAPQVLLLVDRMRPARARQVPTWVLNVPDRPRVDQGDLPGNTQVSGVDVQAGVWRCDAARWLDWTDGDGRAWLQVLRPEPAVLRVAGGPARRLRVTAGRLAGRTYVGGDPNGFERLVIPGERKDAKNAWFRLGEPTWLGPDFARAPAWGRIEVEPPAKRNADRDARKNARAGDKTQPAGATQPAANHAESPTTFVVLLVLDRADATNPPAVTATEQSGRLVIDLKSGRSAASVSIDLEQPGGEARWGDQAAGWRLPNIISRDEPLATIPPATR